MVARHNTTEALPRRRAAIYHDSLGRQPRRARFRASISGRRCRFCNGLRTNGCRSGGCDGACRHRPHLPGARGPAAGADARPPAAAPTPVPPTSRRQRVAKEIAPAMEELNGFATWLTRILHQMAAAKRAAEKAAAEKAAAEKAAAEKEAAEKEAAERRRRGRRRHGRVGQSANGEGVQPVQDEDYIEPLWKFRSQHSDFEGRADAKAQRKT